ncbi:MAG: hypothetical protein LWX56_05920 [Ignavibacteria bacterium]|nr:hypothetical protein [Ignavibacteria bacterium]
MKKLFFIMFICFTGIAVYGDSLFVNPSIYYTRGAYSNGNYTNEGSAYLSLGVTKGLFLTCGYDRLTIFDTNYTYLQKGYVAGLSFSKNQWFMNGYFMHITGKYDAIPFPFTYSDNTNIAGGFIGLDLYPEYIGLGYTRTNFNGIADISLRDHQTADQITAKLLYVFSPFSSVALYPSFVTLEDGRKLLSTELKFHYLRYVQVTEDIYLPIVVHIVAAVGERAYYFDQELLTVSNQNATQKWHWGVTSEVYLFGQYIFQLGFQHSSFTIYDINYYTAGVKANLQF